MANTKKAENPQITTPIFRLSFPNLFVARAAAAGQDPKFSIVMLFKKDQDISTISQIVVAAAVAKWGTDKTKWPSPLRNPFRDGKEKDYDGYEGHIFCSATSKMKPGIVDADGETQITLPNDIYGGCYARATIVAFAYDKAGNKGVSLGLRNVQKARDGEPFSGKNSAENDFDSITPPDAGGVAGAVAPANALNPLGGGAQAATPPAGTAPVGGGIGV